MAGAKGRSGGMRHGAGRKANTARVLELHGGRDRGAVRPAVMPVVQVEAPADLTPESQAIWLDLAPHAVKAGTLIPGTAAAFARLCHGIAKHAKMEAQIERDGLTYLKVMVDGAGQEHTEVRAHPLIGKAQTAENAIRSGLKDFGINPCGKPLVDTSPKAVDPFAEFDEATG